MDAALVAFLLSALICGAIVFLRPWHQRFSIDGISDFPGKVHARPVPRIGGLAIFLGILAGTLFYDADIKALGLALVLCGLPAFLGGIGEDLTKKVSTVARLLLTFAGAGVAFFLLDARITTLDMPYSGVLLGMAIPSLLFTMFAVGGYAHATNIVDGLNGLAGFSTLIVLAAIAWVAKDVGDQPVLLLALAAMGAVAGFLVWNYPKGALFLGDGGSYFLGFMTAELAVLLVFRNSEVSPWFALTALLYPVCETMFSSYRRKLRGQGAMQADGLHLHTLVYKRLVRRNGKGTSGQNAAAALYLAVLCALAAGPAAAYWDETLVLEGIAFAFVLFYLICYWSLVRFRFPNWLSARPSVHNAPYGAASRPRKAD
jgi:UDP-N-acetylmuramyl pentapeptide phosphotransferase/UDP-N-acetylglucosamine-1-phosphate transferase